MAEKKSQTNGARKPADMVRVAAQTVAELTGRRPETVLALHKEEDGWKVSVEVVELSRIPASTDLLGCYEVRLDDGGEVVGYQRTRRYQRGQADGER